MDKVTQLLCKNRWCVCVCVCESVRERANTYKQRHKQCTPTICIPLQQRTTPHYIGVYAVTVFGNHNEPG